MAGIFHGFSIFHFFPSVRAFEETHIPTWFFNCEDTFLYNVFLLLLEWIVFIIIKQVLQLEITKWPD